MVSVAVLTFAIVAVLILVANFNLNYAVNSSSDAFDVFNSQLVEKNGIAQLVKESILAVAETAPVQSGNAIQTEIANRLSSLTFPAGVSVTLDPVGSAAAVPANPFYPAGTPALTSLPAYFSASAHTRAVAGMGNLFTSLATQGPAADLGRISFTFQRNSSSNPRDNRTYTVNADLFSVPLTNIDVVAYGLPSSGTIPNASPTMPVSFFGPGVSALVVTSNNPINDPSAYPDLFNPTGEEQLPYQFRNAVSYAWNAYELLWSPAYQDSLLTAAGQATPANLPSPSPQGSVYDFSAAQEPVINGVSAVGNAVTIDCAAVTAPAIAVVDAEGVGSVTILGSGSSGLPFVLLIRNTAGGLGRTSVTFTGNNSRPAIYYFENVSLGFTGSPQIEGALFLDPTTVAAGSFTWFGHVSFYAPSNPLGATAATVNDSAAVKTALADLAPRVLLVSTNTPFVPSAAP